MIGVSRSMRCLRNAKQRVSSRGSLLRFPNSHLNQAADLRQRIREIERRLLSVLVDQSREIRQIDRRGCHDAEVTTIGIYDRRIRLLLPQSSQILVRPCVVVLLDVYANDPVIACDIKPLNILENRRAMRNDRDARKITKRIRKRRSTSRSTASFKISLMSPASEGILPSAKRRKAYQRPRCLCLTSPIPG